MSVYCNNNGSKTNSARNVEVSEVGKTRDGKKILEVTYVNGNGETEGYLSVVTESGEKLVRWSGYKLANGRKQPWQWSRAYDVDHVKRHDSSQLELR